MNAYAQEQEELKNDVNNLIKQLGIKAKNISQHCNIDQSYFSLFRNGKKYLDSESSLALREYIATFSKMMA